MSGLGAVDTLGALLSRTGRVVIWTVDPVVDLVDAGFSRPFSGSATRGRSAVGRTVHRLEYIIQSTHNNEVKAATTQRRMSAVMVAWKWDSNRRSAG